jgi:hypothetical protein
MKKLLIIASTLLSFNLMASCPNLTGTYNCLNYEGKSYIQTIKIRNIENGIEYNFSNKHSNISWKVNGEQNFNYVNGAGEKIKMLYRGSCNEHTYINEFMLDNKVNVVRGNSEFFLIEEGYTQKNTVIFPNGSKKTSTEECKRLE